jgi:uncharacterized protein
MSLLQRLQEDMKQAMRNHEKNRLTTIRMAIADIKKQEIDTRVTLTPDQEMTTLTRLIKQRKESYEIYKAAGREELAAQEQFEIDVLQDYLPAQLSDSEVKTLIQQTLKDTAATSIKDLGKVMAILKPKVTGRLDMSALSEKIKAMLSA